MSVSKSLHAVESLASKSAHGFKETAIGVKEKAKGAKDKVKEKTMDAVRSPARKSLKDSEADSEGFLYRETSVQGLVNRRYGALLPTRFVTYRKTDAGQSPTKVWALEEGCFVTPIHKAEFMIRNKGTSTLWALARGNYTKADLYTFTLVFPLGHVHHRDPLKLCFDDEATAKSWQAAIVKNIRQQSHNKHSVTYEDIVHEISVQEQETGLEERESGDVAQPSTPQQVSIREKQEPLVDPFASRDYMDTRAGLPGGSKSASIRHVNGVAVYEEPSHSEQEHGAFMVSAVVRSTPREVFKALAALGKEVPLALDLEAILLESLGERSRVIKSSFSPTWLAHALCAPRETVMQQSWREEEDGTIVLLARSVEHDKAPRPQSSWSWFAPVRTQVKSVGFTLAPLNQRHVHSGAESHECLVTLVLQLDLGGWLSHRSWMSYLLPFWTNRLVNSFMEPLLMSIIQVRDQVEQSRFVVQPFQMGEQKEEVPQVTAGRARSLRPMASSHFKPLKSSRFSTHFSVPSRAPSEKLGGDAVPVETIAEAPDTTDEVETVRERATLDEKYWSCPGAVNFQVRGKNYLQDRKKVKAEEPIFSLASVDLVEFSRQPFHIAPHLPSLKSSEAPFNFVMNLMVPGPKNLALVITWAAEQHPHPLPSEPRAAHLERESSTSASNADSDSELGSSPFDILLARFLAGDDAEATERRDSMFKLIPSIVKGSWVIKQSVGHTPVILGRKLKTSYFRGSGYFEVDVDVGSSRAASSVVGMVQGATTGLVIDMAVVLEGHSPEELPECLLGTVRLSHLDMKASTVLKEGPEAAKGSQSQGGGKPRTPRGSASGRQQT